MTLRVLLVDEDPGRAATLRAALQAAGYEVVAELRMTTALTGKVQAEKPDVIIIDCKSPDRDTLEHISRITRDDPRAIVMFTQDKDQARMRAALKAGISAYVVDGLLAERVCPIVDMALARFEQWQAMRQELDQAHASLAERKIVERAKGIIMKQRQCSEEEAYRLLRKTAMDRNMRLPLVAESVLAMADLLT